MPIEIDNRLQKLIWLGVLFAAVRMLVGGVSVLYLTTKDVSLIEVGYLKSFQALIILVFDIPFAYIADRTRKSLSIKLAILASCLWLLITGLGSHFHIFMVAEFFNAISIALFSGAFIAMLLNGVENEHKHVILSNLQKKQHLFMAACALVGPFLITDVAHSQIWFISAAFMFITFIIASMILKDTSKNHQKTLNLGVDHLVFIRRNVPLLIFLLVIAYLYMVLINFWQPIIQLGIGDVKAFYWGIFFFLILLSQSFAAFIIETYGHRKKGLYLGIIIASGFIVHLITDDKIQIICFVILAFILLRGAVIISSSWFHSQISDAFRATGDAIFNTVSKITLLLFLPAAGFILDKF